MRRIEKAVADLRPQARLQWSKEVTATTLHLSPAKNDSFVLFDSQKGCTKTDDECHAHNEIWAVIESPLIRGR